MSKGKGRDRKMRYTPHIDAELDLHGYTSYEACRAVDDFLRESSAHDYTRVRLVVGKGNHSAQGPVLPNAIKAHLNQRGYTYTYAKPENGGEGALEVPIS